MGRHHSREAQSERGVERGGRGGEGGKEGGREGGEGGEGGEGREGERSELFWAMKENSDLALRAAHQYAVRSASGNHKTLCDLSHWFVV